jgi:hypothetical protein
VSGTADRRGRSGAGSTGNRRRTKIEGQFAPRLIEMIESPVFQVLSLSARRILDRIEIELASHGGNENGNLPRTFDDFQRFGMDRHAIAPAQRELEAVGLIEIIWGVAGNAEFRRPNRFRLTYRHTDRDPPTHDWKRIKTVAEAEELVQSARLSVTGKPRKPKPSGGPRLVTVGETHTEKENRQ